MNEGMTTCGKPSRGRYVTGCRCFMCRVANAEYARARANRPPGDRSGAMVGESAVRRARARVRGWLDEGYSMREVSRATGVSRTVLRTLLHGEHPNAARFSDGRAKLPRRMSRKCYRAIMGCDQPGAKAPGTLVDATPLVSAIGWLVERGVTKYRIAEEAGVSTSTVYQIGRRPLCEHRTMVAVGRACLRLKEEVGR